MLVHPWDAAVDDTEWQAWLDAGRDFGQLVVNGDRGWPVVVPTHFVRDGGVLLVHLARPNPVWAAIVADPRVVLTVTDDYAFVPGTWRAGEGTDPVDGVPTSYYATVQFRCRATILDDPAEKADLLRRQLAHFQPDGDHGEVAVDAGPYHRMLSGIRGLRLEVDDVVAKFKYDDHKPVELRAGVADRLAGRAQARDLAARTQQVRRMQ